MNENKKIVMYDSPEAAEQITLTGWVSKGKDGRFWYKNEHMARYAGCTHMKCDCGGIMEKGWTKCADCRRKSAIDRYNALPFREWDGLEPVCTPDGDKYFFSEEDLIEYMDEADEPMTEIDLLICSENNWSPVNEDYWSDQMPEDSDGELPAELQKALDNLNTVIKTLPPQSYSPGKIRTKYSKTHSS